MRLTCDLCGGALEMKNGSAVCQGCGLTYSMDTLREKMGQPAPTATKTVNTPVAQQSNLLNLAMLEFNNSKYDKAISICDQVLATDYANKDAWQLKIRASNVQSGVAAYQAYYASQKTETDCAQAETFGKKFFGSIKKFNSEDREPLLTVFPEIANSATNIDISESISGINKNISEIRAAQEWENQHKPSTNCEYNEKTTEFRSKLCDRVRWLNDYTRLLEEYRSFAGKPGSDIDSNLVAYCDAILTWVDLIVNFKRWQGEYHHREAVSVYTTKYYYHKYKMVELFYDTSWEYGACNRCKTAVLKVRSEAAARNNAKLAQKAAEEKKRIADYWASHPEEKQELETARKDLQKQVDMLGKKFKNSEELSFQKELEKELEQLKNQRSSLGLFNFKEKKTVDEKISSKELEIKQAKKKCEDLEYEINNQIKDLKFKILKINDRLNLIGSKLKL